MPDPFAPTLQAARARIAEVRPSAYARTRNAIEGAVSKLSPYITHGFVTLADVLSGVASHHALTVQHRFVFELGWRAYFRHVWAQRGEGILQSLHPGPLPDEAYARELPDDIRHGTTGVPAIDEAVRTLHATGSLHNHARMWLARYVVHLRKVHWRTGADWLYGHLLDGDLASNHLSWQWVAGTGSRKPYLFNADNVARYAPAHWHSPGSVIDTSYEALDRLAHSENPAPSANGGSAGGAPGRPEGCGPDAAATRLHREPPGDLGWTFPDAAKAMGRDIWLVHPWSLGERPPALAADAQVIGVIVADFHRAWPWTERRWRFVGQRMAEITPTRWHGDAAAIAAALRGARSVRCVEDPHLTPWLARWAQCQPAPALFPAVEQRCDSFSQWWTRATRGLEAVSDLLPPTAHSSRPPPSPSNASSD